LEPIRRFAGARFVSAYAVRRLFLLQFDRQIGGLAAATVTLCSTGPVNGWLATSL